LRFCYFRHAILRFNITGIAKFAKEMAKKGLGKPKVSLQFELDSSGLCNLVKAEATVDELVIVKEEVEVEDEQESNETVSKDAEKKEENSSEAGEKATAEKDTISKEDDKNDTEAKEQEKPKKKTKIVEKVGFYVFV